VNQCIKQNFIEKLPCEHTHTDRADQLHKLVTEITAQQQ